MARNAAGERGFALIEMLVSAVLVSAVAIGVFAGIDGSAAVSGTDRARSIASQLAQQDQDRMRGLPITSLSNTTSTRTVAISGVNYTVRSNVDWVADSAGTVSCTSGSSSANYLRLRSTVNWPAIANARPIVLTSIMSPPASGFGGNVGNISFQLLDQAGSPLPDIPVALQSPSLTLNTNEAGCAFFGYLAPGSYQGVVNRSGYVDPAGQAQVTLAGSVTANSTATVSHSYAQSAQIAVSFDTPGFGAATAQSVSIANPGLPAGTLTFAPGGAQSQIVAGPTFPFATAYGVYAGSCASSNPTTYNANYFNTNPGQVQAQPGGSSSVTVHEPAIKIQVTRNGSVYTNGAHVTITPTGVGCTETYPAQTTNATGALPAPGFPFGTYTVCADDGLHKVYATGVQNSAPGGTSTVNMAIPASGATSQPCP